MAKQIVFIDKDEPCKKHFGIMIDNGDVVCGCCGGLFEASEKGKEWDLVKELVWVNLDEEMLGDIE